MITVSRPSLLPASCFLSALYSGVDSSLSIAFLGLLLGVRHAVDPDHVAAIGTITTRTTSFRRAAAIGALWGIGHTLTILLVGGGIIAMRVAISPRIGLAMEFAVAIMLIMLGLQNVANARRSETREPSSTRPFVVGMVHGMAGSAAVALLVLATIQDPLGSVLYLLIYGAGTIVGMLLVTLAIAVPIHYTGDRVRGLSRTLHLGAGVVSIVAGLALGYGLFRSPLW